MWIEWGARLVMVLALLSIITGLVVLALPETMEGQEVVRLDNAHSMNLADLIGAFLVGAGALATWAAMITWQRKRIQQ